MTLWTCYVTDTFGHSTFIVGTSKKKVEQLLENADWIDKNQGHTKIEKSRWDVVWS